MLNASSLLILRNKLLMALISFSLLAQSHQILSQDAKAKTKRTRNVSFFQKHKKPILVVSAALAISGLCYLGYALFSKGSNEPKDDNNAPKGSDNNNQAPKKSKAANAFANAAQNPRAEQKGGFFLTQIKEAFDFYLVPKNQVYNLVFFHLFQTPASRAQLSKYVQDTHKIGDGQDPAVEDRTIKDHVVSHPNTMIVHLQKAESNNFACDNDECSWNGQSVKQYGLCDFEREGPSVNNSLQTILDGVYKVFSLLRTGSDLEKAKAFYRYVTRGEELAETHIDADAPQLPEVGFFAHEGNYYAFKRKESP